VIAAGRVRVDGAIVTDPAFGVDESSRVEVDGRSLQGAETRVVYALHKPLGVVSTARDTHGRPTVVDLVGARGLRLYPIGRLDADSSGLMLLSNDGELANRLTHPRFEVPKTYIATLAGGPISDAALRRLREGVQLDDGVTAPARVRRRAAGAIEITIHEGKNRQVRRMCDAVGHPVIALARTAFGPLRLGALAQGEHRRLRAAEVERLRAL
jgi:23S rRNA pseudouridine2605 synthase